MDRSEFPYMSQEQFDAMVDRSKKVLQSTKLSQKEWWKDVDWAGEFQNLANQSHTGMLDDEKPWYQPVSEGLYGHNHFWALHGRVAYRVEEFCPTESRTFRFTITNQSDELMRDVDLDFILHKDGIELPERLSSNIGDLAPGAVVEGQILFQQPFTGENPRWDTAKLFGLAQI